MAQIAVVEDNDAMRAQLCGFIAQYAQESGHQLDVTAFSDGAQLVEPYRPGFDIIFLDIEMPTLGGMPTAERIRRQDPDVVLVFVTNMAQYAIRGYEVDALDFVLKPVSYYQFSTKLERALQRIRRRRGGQVALQVSGGVQLLDTDDILYLETRDRLLHYHTATDTWSVRGSLLKAEKDLAAYHFARCNQCYLVNLRHVRGVQDDLVQVGEERLERLEISRRFSGRAGGLCRGCAVGGYTSDMGDLCCRPVRCGAGLLAAAEKTQEFYHAHRPEFYRGSAVCAGHHLGQQRPCQVGDAAGDLRRLFHLGYGVNPSLHVAGLVGQRILQHLDRPDDGVGL